jgi:hypothetical protein
MIYIDYFKKNEWHLGENREFCCPYANRHHIYTKNVCQTKVVHVLVQFPEGTTSRAIRVYLHRDNSWAFFSFLYTNRYDHIDVLNLGMLQTFKLNM